MMMLQSQADISKLVIIAFKETPYIHIPHTPHTSLPTSATSCRVADDVGLQVISNHLEEM